MEFFEAVEKFGKLNLLKEKIGDLRKMLDKDKYDKYQKNWIKYPKHHRVAPFPLQIDFDLTTRCNLSCERCPYQSERAQFKREPQDLDFDLYKKVIDEGAKKGLCSVKFSFSGEPLLYKKLPDAIMYARQNGIIDVRLNSNGLLLDKALAVQLLISGLTRFTLSDYDIPEQVEKAWLLKDMKKLLHHNTPKLVVQTEHAPRWYGIADEIQPQIWYDYHDLESEYSQSEFECEQPWQRILVLANGDINRCSCGTLFADKIMGNVEYDTIESLWKGEYMNYLRWCHENHRSELIESCVYCPMRIEWIRDNKNKRVKND